MAIVIEQVLLLLAFAAAGYLLSKRKVISTSHSKLLSALCLYIFLPSKVLSTFATRFTPAYLGQCYTLLLGAAAILVVLILAAIPISHLMSKDGYTQNIYQYSLIISNYGYIGYAMAEGIFGQSVLLDLMMFAIPISLYTYTIGYAMLTGGKLSFKKLINPVTLAMVAGATVGLSGLQMPNLANRFLSNAAACMSPCSMLLMGNVIAEFSFKQLLRHRECYVIVALRLLVIPIAVTAVLRLLGLTMLELPALLFLAMPTGMNTIVIPKLIGKDYEPGAEMALISSVLCCITIPICLLIFGYGIG